MPKVFVSYRRSDSQERAHRIADWLVLKYGQENVFLDADTIDIGVPFADVIKQHLRSADVVLIIIGHQWVDEIERRYDPSNPLHDFVLLEVYGALEITKKRNALIIPVLLERSVNIDVNRLPNMIKSLTQLNYAYVRGTDFHSDMERLRKRIDGHTLEPTPLTKQAKPFTPIIIGVVVILVMIGIVGMVLSSSAPSLTQTPTSQAIVQVASDEATVTDILEPIMTDEPTLDAEAIAEQVFSEQQTVVATQWTKTPTLDITSTVFVLLTQWAGETATRQFSDATGTATFTPSDTSTDTPKPTLPPDSLELAMQRAQEGVSSNEEWEASYPEGFMQEFDGVPMILAPKGCFMMGYKDGYVSEQPVHEQCIENPFWIDKYEVTQAQFAHFGGTQVNTSRFLGDNRPIERVTWFEARNFCELRGGRLPTEVEWEYTARGPDGLLYPWGNTWITSNAIWNRTDLQGTANVGSVPTGASWLNVLDMSGNVWEWTSSLFESYPYDANDGRERDSGNRTNLLTVLRGGSWDNSGRDGSIKDDGSIYLLRTTYRYGGYPAGWSGGVVRFGFRCIRT